MCTQYLVQQMPTSQPNHCQVLEEASKQTRDTSTDMSGVYEKRESLLNAQLISVGSSGYFPTYKKKSSHIYKKRQDKIRKWKQF